MLEYKITDDQYGNKLPSISLHETELLEFEAKLAIELLTKWGMVAATEDGEDTAGRSKMRLLRPAEVVNRAFECAELALIKARTKGLTQDIVKIYEGLEDGPK